METDNTPDKALQECEEKLKQLEEENQHLRESSDAFGQLAERLNVTLQEERRNAESDRRQKARQSGDRRNQRNSALRLAAEAPRDRD
jgi:predicted RNase H-like nuclease (RuvC/YqgF family)